MAKERGWHCAFTHACMFETISAPVRIPGTHQVACGPHAQQMQQQRFTGGRGAAEMRSGVVVSHGARRGQG